MFNLRFVPGSLQRGDRSYLPAGRQVGFEPYTLKRVVFICQGCLHAIQNQVEYGISYKYANI